VDFGIAKAMGGEEGQKVTKTGLVVGTPEYMSPEQLSGDTLDGRSDIYSLAIVLYRMLTGVLPFQADSAQETMIKRLTDDPIPLNDARPGLSFPTRLQDVMDRALARMPGDRYASAAQFGSDVTEAVSGMVQAPIPDTEGATQIIDTTAATDVIPKTRVGAARAPTPDTPAPSVAVPAPTAARKKSPVIAIAAAAVIVVGGGTAFMLWRAHGTPPAPAQQSAAMAPDSSHAGNADTSVTGRTDAPVTRHDTSQTSAPPKRHAANEPSQPAAATENRYGLAATDAKNWLDDALIRLDSTNARSIGDTARAFFDDSSHVTRVNRAYAAYVVSGAFADVGEKATALYWARLAVQLDGNVRAYRAQVSSLSGRSQ
jgi:serine/threonine-protein kinase